MTAATTQTNQVTQGAYPTQETQQQALPIAKKVVEATASIPEDVANLVIKWANEPNPVKETTNNHLDSKVTQNAEGSNLVDQAAARVLPTNSNNAVDVVVTAPESPAAEPSLVDQAAVVAIPSSSSNEVDVVFIAGPGGHAFNHQIVDTFITPLKQIENQTVKSSILVGNGEQAIAIDAVIKAVETAKKNHRPITLFIYAHGEMNGDEHQICIDNNVWVPSRELFQRLRSTLGDKYPLSIFMASCYGGGAAQAANEELPEDSTFVALAPGDETVCGLDVKHFATVNKPSSWISSEQLLYDYLLNSLQTRIAPVIVHASRKKFELGVMFKSQCGQAFSEAQRAQVHELLDDRIGKQPVDDIIDKMQNARSEYAIIASEYGRALAVVLAAQQIR